MTERLYEHDAYQQKCEAEVVTVTADGVVLDQTVCYARGGGQPGDSGTLTLSDGRCLDVIDTMKGDGEAIVHVIDPQALAAAAEDLIGQRVQVCVDWARRHQHMRMHTCLHLLCALVDAPVTGGNLTAEKGRLDFDLPEASVDKVQLTDALNELIASDVGTSLDWITDAELAAQPELVKTMSVQPPTGAGRVRLLNIPGIDLQPCGGTHVARLSEIGPVRVTKIEKKSRLNRRISVAFA